MTTDFFQSHLSLQILVVVINGGVSLLNCNLSLVLGLGLKELKQLSSLLTLIYSVKVLVNFLP